MRNRTLVATLVGFSLCASLASAQTPITPPTDPHDMTINQRLENQGDRTQAGTKSDQLTKAERTKVRANDAAIHAQEKVYRQANHGTLTKGEKAHLTREPRQPTP